MYFFSSQIITPSARRRGVVVEEEEEEEEEEEDEEETGWMVVKSFSWRYLATWRNIGGSVSSFDLMQTINQEVDIECEGWRALRTEKLCNV